MRIRNAAASRSPSDAHPSAGELRAHRGERGRVRARAWLVILEFFVVNLLNAIDASQDSGVAFVAHIGGFLAGLVLLPILRIRKKVDYDPWESWRRAGDR
jgi:membrane associated rhomboid family serine protease